MMSAPAFGRSRTCVADRQIDAAAQQRRETWLGFARQTRPTSEPAGATYLAAQAA